jgi:hypothetical protein
MTTNTKFFKFLEYYEAGKWGVEDIENNYGSSSRLRYSGT